MMVVSRICCPCVPLWPFCLPFFPLSSDLSCRLFCSITAGSTKRSLGADDPDDPLPTKQSRTGDAVPDILDPSPPTGREWPIFLRVFQAHSANRPDYSGGHLVSMCSPFFPDLRKNLGRFLVDKTKLIEDVVNSRMHGKVDLVLRPRRCGKSTMLQLMKWVSLLAFHTLYWNLSSRYFFGLL